VRVETRLRSRMGIVRAERDGRSYAYAGRGPTPSLRCPDCRFGWRCSCKLRTHPSVRPPHECPRFPQRTTALNRRINTFFRIRRVALNEVHKLVRLVPRAVQ
jgi:hypothetical protein